MVLSSETEAFNGLRLLRVFLCVFFFVSVHNQLSRRSVRNDDAAFSVHVVGLRFPADIVDLGFSIHFVVLPLFAQCVCLRFAADIGDLGFSVKQRRFPDLALWWFSSNLLFLFIY